MLEAETIESLESPKAAGPQPSLKRLMRGAKEFGHLEASQAPDCASEPLQARLKTGLKLKIKFSGASGRISVVKNSLQRAREAEVESLGLAEHSWLSPACAGWKLLRDSSDAMQEQPGSARGCVAETPAAAEPLGQALFAEFVAAPDIDMAHVAPMEAAAAAPSAAADAEKEPVRGSPREQPASGAHPIETPPAAVPPASETLNRADGCKEADTPRAAMADPEIASASTEAERAAASDGADRSRAGTVPAHAGSVDRAGGTHHVDSVGGDALVTVELQSGNAAVAGPGLCNAAPKSEPGGSETQGCGRAEPDEKEAGEASPVEALPAKAARRGSTSHADLGSSDSESEGRRQPKRARGPSVPRSRSRLRSREPGEHSDSGDGGRGKRQRRPLTKSRSPEPRRSRHAVREDTRRRPGPADRDLEHRRDRDWDRERSLHHSRGASERRYDADARREREREHERRREAEREARHGGYGTSRPGNEPRDSRERSGSRDERAGSWEDRAGSREARGGSREERPRPRDDRAHPSGDIPREGRGGSRETDTASPRARTRDRSPRPLSRLGDPQRAARPQVADGTDQAGARRSQSLGLEDEGPSGHARSAKLTKRGSDALQAQAPAPAMDHAPVFGFADAWNMLYGSASEDIGSEADIETLRAEATKAKHAVDSMAKASGGKYSLSDLVTLMRESYLKYMQLCAIWEAMLRQPNVPSSRTRAKSAFDLVPPTLLADEGGVYPCTIALMRSITNDARLCSTTSEPCRILRVLAEKLVAIMQMRLVQVQRGKLQQDRQLLLACRGAPTSIDSYGRALPGVVDAPGETFQRPSPTDSNASNSTGELSVNPSPSRAAVRPQPAVAAARTPPPSGRALAKHPAALRTAAHGLQQGKANLQGKTGKPSQRPTPHGTPTRDVREEPGRGTPGRQLQRAPAPNVPGREDAWAVEPLPWEIPAHKIENVTRSWSLLGGVAAYTGQFRAHFEETSALMRSRSPVVREAAAQLGLLDVGLGMSHAGVALALSRNVLDLVSQIAAAAGGAGRATEA